VDPFYKQNLNSNHCFLCGEELTPSTRSDEHVFPEWLQRELDLWDQKIQLLNETLIPYRQILIPCCKHCNNSCLSQMENDVSSILNGDFRELTEEEELRLFQWCSKIFYGILHKEMVLLSDRARTDSGPIIEKEFFEQIEIFHYFMTSINKKAF